MLPTQQQRPGSGALSDATSTPEPTASSRILSEPLAIRADASASFPKDKKKGVRFLNRFIGSKKKDAYPDSSDDDSQMGDQRMEGTDADVFSQPIGSNGFIPRFPAPPKYIKMRSHGKKERDFNRVFLAQQLRGRTGVEIAQAGGRHVKTEAYKGGDPKRDGNAIWAMEFSKDGKYLAAGGQDYLVRMWAVIFNPEERRSHELEEDTVGKEGEHVRLNAPVFRSKPVQEYEGHTASILDLSWSKIHVRSAHGKNAKGSKVTGIQAISFPPDDPNGEVKILVTSNDSRVRVYNLRDKGLEMKMKGNENSCSQIRASFSEDAKYVICGSEDRKAYIWPTAPLESDKEKRPVEMFEAHSAIVTTALMAPTRTRQLLSASGDPLYDLCNPPPVTLISRSESHSSRAPTENGNMEGSVPATPAIGASEFERSGGKPEESPAYVARSGHPGGNIIVTADCMGHIKVFRQDCAYQKRLRNDANFSRKMLGRANSVATRHSNRSAGRDSRSPTSQHPSSERINSWRQSISNNNNANVESFRHPPNRSVSPRKPTFGHPSSPSIPRTNSTGTPYQTTTTTTTTSSSPPTSLHRSSNETDPTATTTKTSSVLPTDEEKSYPHLSPETNPLMLQGDQSYMFWNQSAYRAQALTSAQNQLAFRANNHHSLHQRQRSGGNSLDGTTASSRNSADAGGGRGSLGPQVQREMSTVSALSSEEEEEGGGGDGGGNGGEMRCRRCKGASFRAREGGKVLVCGGCGEVV
ncbi:MAG: hypothetical protein Q9179_000173 [Wetmoreana sp. 5 TL-2023]